MRASEPHCPRAKAGFSLLEMVVALSIVVILVGVAVPVTSKVLDHKARVATTEELELLARAAGDYFEDCWSLPADGEDLLVDSGAAGWSGPYLPGVVADRLTTLPGYLVDAWSVAYGFSNSGGVLRLRSGGADRTLGTSDDLELQVDVTPLRRRESLRRLATINQAITLYNGLYQVSAPLSSSWGTAYTQLVAAGFLPASSDYQTDGWGDAFVADPPGSSPLVAVASTHVGQ